MQRYEKQARSANLFFVQMATGCMILHIKIVASIKSFRSDYCTFFNLVSWYLFVNNYTKIL